MSAEIRADLVGDSRGLEKSIDKVASALEEAVDELQTLEKEGDNSTDALVKGMRAAEKATKELDSATEKVGGTTGTQMKKAAGSTSEFKDEAKQNFGEVASSFSGDMASATDLVQGTLGGLAASIGGPLGLALGAASIAIGLFLSEAQKEAEKAEEIRQAAVDAVASARDEGLDVSAFLASADQVVERLQAIEESKEGTDGRWFWQDDPSRLEEWTDALDEVGRSGDEVAQVLGTESPKALRDYKRALEDAQRAADKEAESVDVSTDAGAAHYRQLLTTSEAYGDILKNVDAEIKLRDEATESELRQTDAGLDAALRAQEAAQLRKDTAADVAESISEAYGRMVEDATAFATSEDGALDINRWLTYVQEHATAVGQYQANLALLSMSPEDWNALLAMPEESRTQWVAQVAALPEEARQPFIDALDGIAGNSGSSAATSFEASFAPEADVEVTATTDKAEAAVEAVAKGKYEATVKVKTDSTLTAASTAIDTAARNRSATITVSASTRDLTTQLTNYRPPTLYIPGVIVKPGTRQPL